MLFIVVCVTGAYGLVGLVLWAFMSIGWVCLWLLIWLTFGGCFAVIDLLRDCLAGFWWFGLLATRAFVSLVVVCTWCFVFGLGDSFGFCCG